MMTTSSTSSNTSRGGVTYWMVITAAAGLAILLTGLIVVVALVANKGPAGETQTFVIEAGTGARIDAGEQIDLMPTTVRFSVGDTLELRNQDNRPYMVGPYSVRAGETVSQTFKRPQDLIGSCSLSDSGDIRIVVN